MKNWIFYQKRVCGRDIAFRNPKIRQRCSRKVIKRIGRKLHEAGGCDAEDDYSRGYDDAITLALNILLEETGYHMEDVID